MSLSPTYRVVLMFSDTSAHLVLWLDGTGSCIPQPAREPLFYLVTVLLP